MLFMDDYIYSNKIMGDMNILTKISLLLVIILQRVQFQLLRSPFQGQQDLL